MIISFFSNFINHHQSLLADELYKLTHGNFYFIELEQMPESFLRSGYQEIHDSPYLIQAWKNTELSEIAHKLCLESDVVLFGGSASLLYQIERAKSHKLSFEVSERWLKRGIINILSPRLLKNMWYYHTLFDNSPIYKLCASAYAANDQYFFRTYVDRCFKWGYFTKVSDFNKDISIIRDSHKRIKLMWCARFIKWKHPELAICLAKLLKAHNYSFILNMYGTGELLNKMRRMVIELQLDDCVFLKGNIKNDLLLSEMRQHDIFLLTSDKNEGWGAVANEAMANRCALVVSDEVGCAPYLIKDNYNGKIFRSKSLQSLYESVIYLIDNPNSQEQIIENAYQTISEIWSPANAAKNLIRLINSILEKRELDIIEGPCSKAYPI